jgi:VWFA-related protein
MRLDAVRSVALLLAAALALGAGPAGAQETPAAFGERLEVQLVNLEVLATDGRGEPVTDLEASDFRVFEDGAEVTLTHFSRVEDSEPAGAEDPGGAAGRGVHLALFLDEVHVGAASRRRVLEQIARSLPPALAPEDRVLLAVYDGTVRIPLAFTTDRRALERALAAAERVSAARLESESDRRTMLDAVRFDAENRGCLFVGDYVRTYSEREFDRVRRALLAFSQFVDSLAGIPGRKAVLHLSDGIPLRAGAEISEHVLEMCGGRGLAQGLPGALDVIMMDGEVDRYNPDLAAVDAERFNTAPLWDTVAARANAGRVSIYTLQAGWAPGSERVDASQGDLTTTALTGSRHARNLQDTLFTLADTTGGRAFLDQFAHEGNLAAVARELRSYYLLGYVPGRPQAPGVRRIRVETARPGVHLRYRKSYQPRGADQQVVEKLLGRLFHGVGENPAGARLSLGGRKQDGGAALLELRIPLASLTLVDAGAYRQGMFRVFVVAADGRGATTAVRNSTVPVRAAKDGAAPPDDYTYQLEIKLDRGKHQVAVAVRDELTGETSYLSHAFEM